MISVILLPWKRRVWKEGYKKWPIEQMSKEKIFDAVRELIVEAEVCERQFLFFADEVARWQGIAKRFAMQDMKNAQEKATRRRHWINAFQEELVRRETSR